MNQALIIEDPIEIPPGIDLTMQEEKKLRPPAIETPLTNVTLNVLDQITKLLEPSEIEVIVSIRERILGNLNEGIAILLEQLKEFAEKTDGDDTDTTALSKMMAINVYEERLRFILNFPIYPLYEKHPQDELVKRFPESIQSVLLEIIQSVVDKQNKTYEIALSIMLAIYEQELILIAKRVFHGKQHTHRVELEDLISVGRIKMVQAFERFDPKKSALKTYIHNLVSRVMNSYIYNNSSLVKISELRTESIALYRQISKFIAQTKLASGYMPDYEQISAHLGIPEAKVQSLLEIAKLYKMPGEPLDAPINPSTKLTVSDHLESTDSEFDRLEEMNFIQVGLTKAKRLYCGTYESPKKIAKKLSNWNLFLANYGIIEEITPDGTTRFICTEDYVSNAILASEIKRSKNSIHLRTRPVLAMVQRVFKSI